MSIVYTRGADPRSLALALSPEAIQAGPNLAETCVAARAELLVTSRIGTFDLTAVAAPIDVDLENTDDVVAAVGAGPHSELAATLAHRLATSLGVESRLVTAARPGETEEAATSLKMLAAELPGSDWDVIEDTAATKLWSTLSARSLLVVGAPGGNWFQRQLFGPGARLRAKAPAGSVVVRSAPQRVFHIAEEPGTWLSPHLSLADAAAVAVDPVTPVVEAGVLLGVFRRNSAGGDVVGDQVEDAPSISMTDPIEDLGDVVGFFDKSPMPVIDESGRLVAVVPAEELDVRS